MKTKEIKKSNFKKFKIIELIKKIRIRHLIILIVLLSFNSYAWFIYATKVSMGFSARVTSWNVSFQTGEDETETNIDINVDRIYPGMDTYIKEIVVKNNGEIAANLLYEIKSITILGTVYEVGEEYTSEDLKNKIENEYPFKIKIEIENQDLETQSAVDGKFILKVEWPFESGDDAADTLWGETAYTYYSTHPSTQSLSINIDLIAMQKNSNS